MESSLLGIHRGTMDHRTIGEHTLEDTMSESTRQTEGYSSFDRNPASSHYTWITHEPLSTEGKAKQQEDPISGLFIRKAL